VNNLLREMTAHDNFVTAFYGVLDAKNRVFTFANGGHNPPILMRATGEIIRLREGGPLVGVIQDAVYEERPVWLMPGDMVVFFTDGVTEAQKPNGEEYGEQRLLDLVSAHRDETAAQLCARIHESVLGFVEPGPQTDDITLILIKVAS
jgi:sigma-B regulation protein RsbU (phosphoserine phosphatase)